MVDSALALAPAAKESSTEGRQRSQLRVVLTAFGRDRIAVSGLIILGLTALVCALAGILAPYDPLEVNPTRRLAPIGTSGYPLGTDELGRDMLSRLLWGGQVSLRIAFVPVLLSMVFGLALGLTSGYFGKTVDSLIMRSLDVLLAFPSILLALGIAAALGPGMENAVLAITVVAIPALSRIVRSSVLSVRQREFVEAARAAGAGHLRIIVREILPNVISPVIVYSTLETGRVMILAASLSFLGLGVKPPTADWGSMLATGRTVLGTAPHVATVPGLVIFMVTLACNVVGDAVRDALDPRQNKIRR
jgi:peptide/nickel transport system permease protein